MHFTQIIFGILTLVVWKMTDSNFYSKNLNHYPPYIFNASAGGLGLGWPTPTPNSWGEGGGEDL